jgi:hypothetical protein
LLTLWVMFQFWCNRLGIFRSHIFRHKHSKS